MKRLFFILAFLFFGSLAHAQTTVQVVRKNYENTVSTAKLKRLSVSAEKADIELITWSKPEIKYEVIVSTKHPEKAQTLADYDKMKFLQTTQDATLYLRSYLVLQAGEKKPKSAYAVSYRITVPKTLNLTIKNSFGAVQVSGIAGELSGEFKFCESTIENTNAKCSLSTEYGKITIINAANDIQLKSRHTTIELEQIQGTMRVDADYGKINLKQGANAGNIKLKTDKTVVQVDGWQQPKYGVSVVCKNTEVTLPTFFGKTNQRDGTERHTYGSPTRLAIEANMGSLRIK